jgi:hypothetical protein
MEAVLNDVPTPHMDFNFGDMFLTQTGLQQRLNQLPTDTADFRHMAAKSVYWTHCVRAEIEELTDWLLEQKDETWVKEMQMEAIDIVHFVFNIGIELGLTTQAILVIERAYEHQDWLIESARVHAAVMLLDKSLIKYVNLLPWKTWKATVTVPDSVELLDAYTCIL